MKQLSTTQIQTISGGKFPSSVYAFITGFTLGGFVPHRFHDVLSAGFSGGLSGAMTEWHKDKSNSPTSNSWANHQPQATSPIDSCLLKDCKISS